MPTIVFQPVTTQLQVAASGAPVDPCGHIVDHLRSCYRTVMRFGIDCKQVRLIRWHWTAKGAKTLPMQTAFVSRNWAEPQPYPDLGEVWLYPRRWVNGSFPLVLPGDDHFCGAEDVWENGWAEGCPPELPKLIDNVPVCCGPPIGPLVFLLFPGTT